MPRILLWAFDTAFTLQAQIVHFSGQCICLGFVYGVGLSGSWTWALGCSLCGSGLFRKPAHYGGFTYVEVEAALWQGLA